jgi:GAF domain-containing protein
MLPADSKKQFVYKNTADLMSKIHLLIDSISSLTGEQYTLENFAEAILKIGVDLTPSEIAWFYKMDFSQNCLERLGANSKQEKISPRLIEISDHNAVCQVARNGTVKIIKDSKKQNLKAIQSTKYRSQIILPMKRGELTIGVLVFASTLPNAFSDEEIRILHLFSLLAASAFDQAKLRLHLQRISKSILQGYDVLQNAIVHATNDLTGKSVALWLLDEATDELTVAASLGISENFKKKAKIKYVGADDSLIAHAFLEKQPVNIENLNNAGSGITVKLRDLLNKEKWNTALIVPIFDSAEKPIGALALKNFVDEKFGRFEVDFLLNFASQIAIVFDEVRVQKKLESLADIGKFAFQDVTADVSPVLKRIADAGCKITGADYIAIFPYHRHIPNYYDNNNIVVSGPDKFEFRERPRERGLTVITREIDEIVVYNVQEGEISESSQKRLQQSGFSIEEAVERIQNANFIKTKEIKSFVGISIKAKRVGAKKAGLSENVGMLYIDFAHEHRITEKELDWIRIFSQQVGNFIYNARISEDLKHRARGHQTLNQIGSKLSGLLNEDKILKEIAKYATKGLECIHCSVFRLQKSQLVVAATDGEFAEDLLPGRTFELGEGVAGWVAQNKKAAFVIDTSKDERYELGWHNTQNINSVVDQNEPGSLIVVPIFLNDIVYGVISIEQRHIAGFSKLDLEFLEILARQASSAIENAQLVQRLRILNDASRELSSKSDIQIILNETINAVFKTIGCNHSSFFVFEDGLLKPKASKSRQEQQPVTREFRMGEGLVGRVAEFGKPIFTNDARKEEGFKVGERVPDVDRSMILVSVKTTGGIFGVISVDQDRVNAFGKQDLQIVETLALQVGIALENAKLLKQMNLLHDISTAINAASNVDNSLQLIIEGARKLIGANAGIVHLINTEKMEISKSYAYPPDSGSKLAPRFSQQKGFTWEIYKTGKAVAVSDLEKSERANEEGIKLGIRALIGIPLKVETKIIGVLFLNETRTREFSSQEIELLSLLANNAAIAVEKSRLIDNVNTANNHLDYTNSLLETKINNLNAVIEMGRRLTASVDLTEKQVLHLIYDNLHPLMNTENMYIALYDHATDMVCFPVMFVDGQKTEISDRKAGSGRTEFIISSKKHLFVQTREESIAWYKEQGREEYIGEPFASWIGVPMISGSRVIGVIAAYHLTNNHEYDQDDLDVLQAIANQAAIALEVTRRIAELKALQSLTNDLSTGLL